MAISSLIVKLHIWIETVENTSPERRDPVVRCSAFFLKKNFYTTSVVNLENEEMAQSELNRIERLGSGIR